MIRVGTSGAMRPDINVGSLALITAAIRDEGTSTQYLPIEFPAVADIDIVQALIRGSQINKQTYFTGITQSKDSFYGQHNPEQMPISATLLERWKAWQMGGAICSEMESSILFILGSIYKIWTGGIMLITGTQEKHEKIIPKPDLNGLIQTTVDALRILIEADRQVR